MKQLVFRNPGNAVVEEAPVPSPGHGQVLVKVLGVNTCPHWDIHLMDGAPMFPSMPLSYPFPPGKPGHEGMGEVIEVGSGVEKLTPGTLVAAWRDAGGEDEPGWYAEYIAFGEENLLKVDDSYKPEQIASLELAMCVQVSFDSLLKQDLVTGKRFAVGGLGPAGLVAVQMAKAYGASEVIGFDPLESRRSLATTLGAHRAVDPQEEDTFPSGRSGKSAFDTSLDCTGLKASIEFLMDRTKNAVSIFGVLRENLTFGPAHWGGLSLMGYGDHNLGAAKRALALLDSGGLNMAPLSSVRLPLSRYADGVEMLRRKEAIKVLFDPAR